MDDIVLRGMAKWPNVPAVYGWLALDRRGRWLIKGDAVANPGIAAFIGRNYAREDDGRWYFQNGPQRVYVTLEYTPLVYRVLEESGSLILEAHTGARAAALRGAWIDEQGALIVETEHGPGLVHDRDLDALVDAFSGPDGEPLSEDALELEMDRLQQGRHVPLVLRYRSDRAAVEPLRSSELPRRFGFEPRPTAPEGHPECA
jgi:hypothetical protein